MHAYRDLLDGQRSGDSLWQELKIQSQLGVVTGNGVTRGSLNTDTHTPWPTKPTGGPSTPRPAAEGP